MKTLPLADENTDEARALARFAAVQAVIQAVQNGNSLGSACQQAALQAWDGRLFAAATIEDWYYGYKHNKFAALQNQRRSDKGQNKALDPAAVEALCQLRRAHPTMTVKALTAELLRQGVLTAGTFSDSTLQRRLAEAGLDRQSLRAGSGLIGGGRDESVRAAAAQSALDGGLHARPRAQDRRRSPGAAHVPFCPGGRLFAGSVCTASSTRRSGCMVFWIRYGRRSRPAACPINYTPTTARRSAASTSQSSARISKSGCSTASRTTVGRRGRSSAFFPRCRCSFCPP